MATITLDNITSIDEYRLPLNTTRKSYIDYFVIKLNTSLTYSDSYDSTITLNTLGVKKLPYQTAEEPINVNTPIEILPSNTEVFNDGHIIYLMKNVYANSEANIQYVASISFNGSQNIAGINSAGTTYSASDIAYIVPMACFLFVGTNNYVYSKTAGASTYKLDITQITQPTATVGGFYYTDYNFSDSRFSGYPSSYALVQHLENNYTPTDTNNPHPGGDQPDPDDGGDGDFDYTPDPIDIPDLPTVTATSSGLVSLYAPTSDQLKALADFLWSDAFSLESFKKLFNNPMDAILGLYLIPVNVGTGAAKEITVGNIVSTVSCNTVTTQYVAVDCGTFTFSKSAFTNSFLDWSPYTKCYLYLPFIGTQEINIDEFMGTTMHVVYHVDVMTGAMLCYVANSTDGVIYEYMGQCSENIPLSSSSYSNTIGSILNAAASVGGVVATAVTGGAAAPAALGLLGGASTATAQAASSLKPSVSHSGNIGGGAGIMSVNYPYLIFITPRTDISSSQYKYTGTPSNKVTKLSNLSGSGFNQIEAINLSVKGATDTEIAEIDATLKAGVIL